MSGCESSSPDRREAPVEVNAQAIKNDAIKAIRTIFDPEIPVNIHDLGLIYGIDVSDAGVVSVQMTLTSPNCPVAEALPNQVKQKIKEIPGVSDAAVQIVWEPPWTPEKMSDVARLELELRGIPDLSHIHKKDRFTSMTIGRKPNRPG